MRNEKRGTRNEERETRNYGKNPQNADFGFIIFFAGRRGRRPLHTRRKFCKTTVYRTESLIEAGNCINKAENVFYARRAVQRYCLPRKSVQKRKIKRNLFSNSYLIKNKNARDKLQSLAFLITVYLFFAFRCAKFRQFQFSEPARAKM